MKSWAVSALAGVVGGVVGAVIIAIGAGLLPSTSSNLKDFSKAQAMMSATPALDHLDTLRCPRGLRRVVQVQGQEDGFSRTGEEPSRVDPAMLRFGLFSDMEARLPRVIGRRDYDEGGADRAFIDYFKLPKGTISAVFVMRLRGVVGTAENDSLQIFPRTTYAGKSGQEQLAGYGFGITNPALVPVGDSTNGVFELALESVTPSPNAPQMSFFEFVKEPLAPDAAGDGETVSIIISDDTMVDVVGLSVCVEPLEIRGVTFVEHSGKPLGPDVSVLSCMSDPGQSGCDPFSGDTLCTTALPLACYKPGNRPMPDIMKQSSLGDSFNGGQVRLTEPVVAASFKTRLEADAFCSRQFGDGTRVLQYADGTAAAVVSMSPIPIRTRVWVDIGDQPRGRCWDRPQPGSLPE